ncbi:MAG: hypothetical protein J4F36_09235 [Nitrosopumilaceae archaeon]|nr:hypothetical protein [Nitrosopumilaceae archaeon]
MNKIIFPLLALAIITPQAFAESLPLTVSLDDTFYDEGDLIIITGTGDVTKTDEKYFAGIEEPEIIPASVSFQMFDSVGNFITIDNIELSDDGTYHKELIQEINE